ncbi:hypothetical protein GmHk_20G057936 [Glycine max]|nr:hypothetical protein GmHk_20G057936 [Glycine max]
MLKAIVFLFIPASQSSQTCGFSHTNPHSSMSFKGKSPLGSPTYFSSNFDFSWQSSSPLYTSSLEGVGGNDSPHSF